MNWPPTSRPLPPSRKSCAICKVCCSLKSSVLNADSKVRSPSPVSPKNWARTMPPKRPRSCRSEILDIGFDGDRSAKHRRPRRPARRAAGRPIAVRAAPYNRAARQQAAAGARPEKRLNTRSLRERLEIVGDHLLGAAGVAANPKSDQPRHQHLKVELTVGDSLLGHRDRGDIAGVAQDRRGAVADFADHRDRLLGAEIGSIGRAQGLRREAPSDPRTSLRSG